MNTLAINELSIVGNSIRSSNADKIEERYQNAEWR